MGETETQREETIVNLQSENELMSQDLQREANVTWAHRAVIIEMHCVGQKCSIFPRNNAFHFIIFSTNVYGKQLHNTPIISYKIDYIKRLYQRKT